MNNYQSKIVTSDQKGPHEDLIKIISRYSVDNYQRPIPDFSKKLMDNITPILDKNKKIILDTGCGTGESSYNLAIANPDCYVIGIDKSFSRIERNNQFKVDNKISNYQIFRGELLDIWPMLYEYAQSNPNKIVKQCLFYPNPWPKKKALKRRWQASPVIPFICQISSEIEVRSNWKIYIEEMQIALEYFTKNKFIIEKFIPEKPMTLFEKKYHLSGQDLYSLKGKLH